MEEQASVSPNPVPLPPVPQSHHRNVSGGVARAAVFGASDGLVSNVSLILGVAGATTSPSFVRVAGLAGLVAGAFSMAAGEYISMRAQTELLERELRIEAEQIAKYPAKEKVELAQLYQSRGVSPKLATDVAEELMSDPQRALEVHAREELGFDPGSLGSPVGAALGSFVSFAGGALIPLFPWFFTEGTDAVVLSLILAVVSATAIGVALASFTGKSPFVSAARQVGIAAVAAVVTYAVGSLLGVEGSP